MATRHANNNPWAGLSESDIEVLKLRALRYAKTVEFVDKDVIDASIFLRGETRYAIPLTSLREIRLLTRLCRIPGSSPTVTGIFHYRGEILSVHDLQAFMHGDSKVNSNFWILVVEREGERLGLMADDVIEIRSIPKASYRPLPITLGHRSSCFQGVLEDGVLVLDPDKLFTTAEFFNAF